ncbi:hypothetical protein V5O48_004117 [Marasmius crinis-equi]|uniref:Cupredoxin n=1 Tax=Marasmius crinis-equi TaxID=585013 RepID=A0ABR3FR03_9AGAR
MRFSTVAATLLPAAGVLAATQTVTVGDNNALAFSPSSLTAAMGDTIEFQFKSKNHSVSQSTFTDPCQFKSGGVDSGFQVTPPNATEFASWSFQVNTTEPLWFFCAQTAPAVHCKAGMVFALNATPDKSFDAFKNAAMGGAAGGNGTSSSDSSAPASSGSAGGSATDGATGGASPTSGSSSPTSGSSSSGSSGSNPTDASAAANSSPTGNSAFTVSGNAAGLMSMAALVLGLTL